MKEISSRWKKEIQMKNLPPKNPRNKGNGNKSTELMMGGADFLMEI